MADQQSSELLRVLGQLDDAAWAETLLPLLRGDESAGAVALACKQLRRLCQGNQGELELTGANCQHLGPLELDALSRPFPACSGVVFTASSTDDVAYRLTHVVPLLARLANLQSLQLDVSSSSSAASQPAHMAPALQLLRLQLPQLRSLQLELRSSWASDSQDAWAVLGATMQLTKLVVSFNNSPEDDECAGFPVIREDDDEDDADPGLSLRHVPALQPLGSGLQHLELTAAVADTSIRQDCSFLSSFSALTSLTLPLTRERSGLAAISSCTALQDLQLLEFGNLALDPAECAALAQLTRLTGLDIPSSSDAPALLSALQCLSGLQALWLQAMSSSHLPALASLTRLTSLRGSWARTPAAPGASQHACPSVVEVLVLGPFPLSAFPGATSLSVCETWRPSRLASLSQHMKALKGLGIDVSTKKRTFRSLDPSAPEAERVAAVRSLGQLVQLTELQFAVNDDAEAVALATAFTQLKDLQHVWLFVPSGSSITAPGLSSCVCNASLHGLTLNLYGVHPSRAQAQKLLAGLSGVRRLRVFSPRIDVRELWGAAAAAARAAGLPLPAACCEFGWTDE